MSELKPCPFCKGNGKLHTGVSNGIPSYPFAYVGCDKCKARTRVITDTKEDGSALFDAIEAWNKRKEE